MSLQPEMFWVSLGQMTMDTIVWGVLLNKHWVKWGKPHFSYLVARLCGRVPEIARGLTIPFIHTERFREETSLLSLPVTTSVT